MAILEKEVWVTLSSNNISHYESLGYKIHRYKDSQYRLKVRRGTKILVKTNDLQDASDVSITKLCDICGEYVPNQPYKVIKSSRLKTDGKDRCKKCAQIYSSESKKTRVKTIKTLKYYAKVNHKLYLLDEFSDKNNKNPDKINYSTKDKFLWNCPECHSEYNMSLENRTLGGQNCPFCSGKKVNDTNCLATTSPETANILLNPDDGLLYTKGSKAKVDFKCPNCSLIIKNKSIYNIVNRGLSCPQCSDGVSYPEKFMRNLLDELSVEYEYQKSFQWAWNKKYDFFIPALNMIIETHGGQHYTWTSRGRTLEEEQMNDLLKEKLAKSNGIKYYIAIDCRESNPNYIKESIFKSDLRNTLNIETVSWESVFLKSEKSLVYRACDLWNMGITSTSDIAKMLKLNRSTILTYLKKGKEIGICNYSTEFAESERLKKNRENGKKHIKKAGLVSAENRKRKVVCVNTEEIFNSVTEANLYYQTQKVGEVCRKQRKTAGRDGVTGQRLQWMYKEDYDQYIKQAK